jgi:hypothetical protein
MSAGAALFAGHHNLSSWFMNFANLVLFALLGATWLSLFRLFGVTGDNMDKIKELLKEQRIMKETIGEMRKRLKEKL